MKILDCTLRDGGYYTNWDFATSLVSDYLTAMAESGVDMVEMGLRNNPGKGFKGASFYTTDEYLNTLELPNGPAYGVMVDAKTILQSGKPVAATVDGLFRKASSTKLNFVRVACHFHEVSDAEEIVKSLKKLGYQVFVNLMQITERSTQEILHITERIAKWSELDGLYFADSLGSMGPMDVSEMTNIIRTHWNGPLGIHAHNNMGQALLNGFAGMDSGLTLIDATVTGMGRGAGNAETELLIAEMEIRGSQRYKVSPLVTLIFKYFEDMKAEYGWGQSLPYYLAARYKIHPTYVQEIFSSESYGTAEKLAALVNMPSHSGSVSYDGDTLKSMLRTPTLTRNVSSKKLRILQSLNLKETKKALIIANGPSSTKYSDAIKLFALRENVNVFSLNNGIDVLSDIVDVQIACSVKRKLSKDFFKVGKKIIGPPDRFTEEEMNLLDNDLIYEYPMSIAENEFKIGDAECIIPYDLTLAYALAAILSLGQKIVYLVGFDGYAERNIDQKNNSETFHLAQKKFPEIKIIALTPTTYPIDQQSIFSVIKT